jgi:putative peptide zinc metalloprotease protein
MEITRDHRVRELRRTNLTLRSDLRFTPQTFGDRQCYVIEDPIGSRFFRIGVPEYAFISLLDGQTTIDEAIRLTAAASPAGGFGDHDAAAICRWLVENHLAHTVESAQRTRLDKTAQEVQRRNFWQRINPLMLRVPLWQPDPLFARVTPWLRCLYSFPVVSLWAAVLAVAGYEFGTRWERFASSSERVFAPGNWLWLLVCWLVLKVIHETSHAVVCRKYGGTVREAGLMFILLAPIAYVDVTCSWRFRSKWQRIFTAAAGMYIELWLGAVAALTWSRTEPGPLNYLCLNAALMASVTTVIFNANPLMRFDGYYILSDLLGLPNLSSSGQEYLRYWMRRYLLGMPATIPTWSTAAGWFIRLYGVAALVWRAVVYAGLLAGAAALFHGAGIALAAGALALWLVIPLVRLVKYAVHGRPGERPKWFRCTAIVATTGGILAAVLFAAPWPLAQRAPAMVEFEPLTVIRPGSPGFVQAIHVRGGQFVESGDVLVVLKNDELQVNLTEAELKIQQSLIRSRQYENKEEIAAFQAESAAREALEKQRDELRTQVAELTIRAPRSGKVIGRNLPALLETYVEKGTELLAIGNDEQKELRISIAQDDLDLFAARAGETMHVRLSGYPPLTCPLKRISPRASVEPPHRSFCAPLGGPLAVRARKPSADKKEQETQYEFFAPRFTGYGQLNTDDSTRLMAGQLGVLSFRASEDKIGPHLYHQLDRWVRERLRPPQ